MSTCSEFIDKVREHLCTKYEVEYTGNLIYTVDTYEDSPSHYKLSWGLNQDTYPFIMQGDFNSEDAFYTYVVKQIAVTRFFETSRFIAKRITVPDFIVEGFKDPLLTFDEQK